MNFQQFRSAFQSYPIISRIEIEKVYPGFDPKNLVHWQKNQYLQKIRNTWYRLKETPLDSDTLFLSPIKSISLLIFPWKQPCRTMVLSPKVYLRLLRFRL